MRTLYWFFAVSVALFISGIALVIAAARMVPEPARANVPVTQPVASIKQVMNGIVTPAATSLFGAVGTIVSDKGIEELAPRSEQEWQSVGNSAAALVESGNLLMMERRAVDGGEWMKMSQALVDAGKVALDAIDAKSADDLLAAGEAVNMSCDACHQRYQRQ